MLRYVVARVLRLFPTPVAAALTFLVVHAAPGRVRRLFPTPLVMRLTTLGVGG